MNKKTPVTRADLDAAKDDIAEVVGEFIAELQKRLEALEACPVKYVGTWKRGEVEYDERTLISHRGGMWFARKRTTQEPGKGPDWQLAVKSTRVRQSDG